MVNDTSVCTHNTMFKCSLMKQAKKTTEMAYLSKSHEQREVNLVSVSQNLQNAIQVDLVFTEAP